MEGLVIALVYAIVGGLGYAWRDRSVDGPAVSLCLTCVNAVITRGTRGEELVACSFAGILRPVKFTVCECTGYSNTRNVSKLVKIEGFAREAREVYAEIAIP